MPNPFRLDPSKTTQIQRRYFADWSARAISLQLEIRQFVEAGDAFGLDVVEPFTLNAGEFRFQTILQKVESFKQWLAGKIESAFYQTDAQGNPWNAKHIESAYQRAVLKAFRSVRKGDITSEFFLGQRDEFQKSLAVRSGREKLKLLFARAFEEVKGVTSDMAAQLSRIVSDGLSNGDSAKQISKALTDQIARTNDSRVKRVVRSQIVHSNAEGNLDTLEDMGIQSVQGLVEFITTSGRPCPICAAKAGGVYTIAQARGIIPVHPNCQCDWVPVFTSRTRPLRSGRTASR
jgi:hypothetical protein